MKLRCDLISMWEARMIFQGSSGAVGQPAGSDVLRGRVLVPVVASGDDQAGAGTHRARRAGRTLEFLRTLPA